MWIRIHDRIPLFSGSYLFKSQGTYTIHYKRFEFCADKGKLYNNRGNDYSHWFSYGSTEWWEEQAFKTEKERKFKLKLKL